MAMPGSPRPAAVRALAIGMVVLIVVSVTALLLVRGGGGDDVEGAAPPPSPSASRDRDDPATDPAYQRFYSQKLTWKNCDDGFSCATAVVPMDWDEPAGETIELAMIRVPAGGDKIGSLLRNPGGPGASGVQYLRDAVESDDPALRRYYDMVSWDTRGTGESAALKCLPDSELDAYYSADATPDTPAEEASFVQDATDYAQACRKNSGALFENVDTISTVKDMDVMRAVLGDQVLSYMGGSYGSYLGAWYAELFPWRVGRLVLDGAVDPSLTSEQYADGQALGFSRAVKAYVDDCLSQRSCPLRGSRTDAYAQLQRLLDRADQQPLRTDTRPLTEALLVTGLIQGLYAEQLWPIVTDALTTALQGDGTAVLALADFYLGREEDGSYGQALQALGPIYCLDHDDDQTLDQIRADAVALQRKYPPFGGGIGWSEIGCSVWPIEATVPARKLVAAGAAPILVVGTTGDPATPYEWAQSLADQLESGVLLTREGQGHTAYGMGNTCIDKAIVTYLVRGAPPAEGTRCA